MQRIYSTRSPKTHTSPWAVLPAIAMAAMITAGSLATMVLSEKTIDRDTVVNTSSDVTTTDKASMKISDVVLRVTNALANGDITSTQAAQYILAAQQNLQAAEAFAAYKQEVIEAYKAGDIERTDIRPKLAAFKKQLDATMVNQLKERMNTAVKNGVMTKEDVLQIWSMHKTMSEQASKVLTRDDYAQAQAKMQAMVEAGTLTQAQMTEKLSAMRKMIGKAQATQKTVTRADYAQAQAKMQAMVEAGKLTQAQMTEKLSDIRKMIGKAQATQKTVTRADYAQAQAKMQAMVEAGKLTQAQMTEKLSAMRKMIGKAQATQKTVTRADYAQAQAKMQAMVEAGKLTQAQMTEKLSAMRKMIGRGRGQARGGGERANGGDGGASDECMTLRRRLGAAVSNGDMTRKEAGEIWQAQGCSR